MAWLSFIWIVSSFAWYGLPCCARLSRLTMITYNLIYWQSIFRYISDCAKCNFYSAFLIVWLLEIDHIYGMAPRGYWRRRTTWRPLILRLIRNWQWRKRMLWRLLIFISWIVNSFYLNCLLICSIWICNGFCRFGFAWDCWPTLVSLPSENCSNRVDEIRRCSSSINME